MYSQKENGEKNVERMRRVFVPIGYSAIIAACIAAGSALASDTVASGPVKVTQGHYFCVGLEDPTPTTPRGRALYSAVFVADGNKLMPIRTAFTKFLQKKYAYSQDPTTLVNSIQCVGTHSAKEATTVLQARMKPGKQLNPGGTLQTGWSPSS